MKHRYIPFALRQQPKKKKVILPKRKESLLKKDKALIQYHREMLLLLTDLCIDTSERLLDSEIQTFERLNVQKCQNELYKINEVVKKILSESTTEMHEDRVEFVTEMIALCTLVKPKFFEKAQAWFVEQIKRLHGMKPEKLD